MATPLTGKDIINKFQNLVDEEVDQDLALDLANTVKDIIEGDRPWRMLIKEDKSQSFDPSDDYLTAKDLPDDFLMDYKVFLGDATEDSYTEYYPVPFEERRRYKDSQAYYIDVANKKIYICGSVDKSYTIYLYYIYETDDLTLKTSPVWPSKFHKIIPYMMAEIWKAGIDYDEINVQQALENNKVASMLYEQMIKWDAQLKLQSIAKATPIQTKTGRRTDIIEELSE